MIKSDHAWPPTFPKLKVVFFLLWDNIKKCWFWRFFGAGKGGGPQRSTKRLNHRWENRRTVPWPTLVLAWVLQFCKAFAWQQSFWPWIFIWQQSFCNVWSMFGVQVCYMMPLACEAFHLWKLSLLPNVQRQSKEHQVLQGVHMPFQPNLTKWLVPLRAFCNVWSMFGVQVCYMMPLACEAFHLWKLSLLPNVQRQSKEHQVLQGVHMPCHSSQTLQSGWFPWEPLPNDMDREW